MRTPHLSTTTSTPDRRRPPRREPLGIVRAIGMLLAAVGLVAVGSAAIADGTEELGPASVSIAEGSGIVAAGTGMVAQPATLDVEVPAGASVEQVLLYWEGMDRTNTGGDDTIVVDGNAVTGDLIGGPTLFFNNAYSSAFRADITALGLVGAGSNSLTVEGLEFTRVNDGAGVLVIYDDGSTTAEIGVRDGLDLAFVNFVPPLDTTVAQTFTFATEDADRVADLSMFFSSVAGQDLPGDRPSVIEVTVDGVVAEYVNLLASNDGDEWDTVELEVTIPAGVGAVTVQALSEDRAGTNNRPASFGWITASLSVPTTPLPPPGGGEGCTPGYWKQPHHLDSWAGYSPDADYATTFGVDASFDLTLLGALRQGGGGEKALGRHAVAALLNAASDVDYASTTAEVIALVQDAYASGDFEGAKDLLAGENEQECPLD